MKKFITELQPIRKSDHLFLYEMLKERNPKENISHKKIPSFKQHTSFVSSKPYSKWYIILYKKEKAGSIYLSKQNEIGIHIKNNLENIRIAKDAIKIIIEKNPRKKYFANISIKNKKLMKFFDSQKFYKLQVTYELDMEK
jgi:glucose-6-phosphate 1-dehydrogenase